MSSEEVSISRPREGRVQLVILALFFLSGACALVYEVVWMRMLTLVFGATAFATSTILASFFAGLALGSFYFGRVIDRGKDPLLVYALLEAGIGISAFLMPLVFSGLTEVYVGISQHYALELLPDQSAEVCLILLGDARSGHPNGRNPPSSRQILC